MRVIDGKQHFPALVWRRGMTYRCAEGQVKAQAGEPVRCGMDGDAIANSMRLGYIMWRWVPVDYKPAKPAAKAPVVKTEAKAQAQSDSEDDGDTFTIKDDSEKSAKPAAKTATKKAAKKSK